MTNAYFNVLLLVSFSGYFLCDTQSQEHNVGTVLFSHRDLKKPCWTYERLATLAARRHFQALVPGMIKIFNEENYGIDTFLKYVTMTYTSIQKSSSDSEVNRILHKAYSDVIGGFLKLIVIPCIKIMFYLGAVNYNQTIAIQKLYNQILKDLGTNGAGWHSFVLDTQSMAYAVAFRKRSLNSKRFKHCSQDSCKMFAYLEATPEGLNVPIPKINWEDKTIFLPIINETNFSLKSPKHIRSVRRYYDNARCCARAQNWVIQDFEMKFKRWLISQMLHSMLMSEPVYPPLAEVLQIIDFRDAFAANLYPGVDKLFPRATTHINLINTVKKHMNLPILFNTIKERIKSPPHHSSCVTNCVVSFAIGVIILILFFRCYKICIVRAKQTNHYIKSKIKYGVFLMRGRKREDDANLTLLRSALNSSRTFSTETKFLKYKIFEGVLPPSCDSNVIKASDIINKASSRNRSIQHHERRETKSIEGVDVLREPYLPSSERRINSILKIAPSVQTAVVTLQSSNKRSVPTPTKSVTNNDDESKKDNVISKISNHERVFITHKTDVPNINKNCNILKTKHEKNIMETEKYPDKLLRSRLSNKDTFISKLPRLLETKPEKSIMQVEKNSDKLLGSRQPNKDTFISKLPRNTSISHYEKQKSNRVLQEATKLSKMIPRLSTIVEPKDQATIEKSSENNRPSRYLKSKEGRAIQELTQHSKIPSKIPKIQNKPTSLAGSRDATTRQDSTKGITVKQLPRYKPSFTQECRPEILKSPKHLETEKISRSNSSTLRNVIQRGLHRVSKKNVCCTRIKDTYEKYLIKLKEQKKNIHSKAEDTIPLLDDSGKVEATCLTSKTQVSLKPKLRGKESKINVTL